jgi:lipoprotein-anchoring transpeptidase ErfK/SrfK
VLAAEWPVSSSRFGVGGQRDSTIHKGRIGTPDSHGCIRMRNADVAALDDMMIETGTPLLTG